MCYHLVMWFWSRISATVFKYWAFMFLISLQSKKILKKISYRSLNFLETILAICMILFFTIAFYYLPFYIQHFIFLRNWTKWRPKKFNMGSVGPPRNIGISSKLNDWRWITTHFENLWKNVAKKLSSFI